MASHMHWRHSGRAKGPSIVFGYTVQHLLDDHTRIGATPSSWPTETSFIIAVGHHNDVMQAFTLDQLHQGKGLRAGGVYTF